MVRKKVVIRDLIYIIICVILMAMLTRENLGGLAVGVLVPLGLVLLDIWEEFGI